jgi:NAD(P)-dependent dehydrogenase (short-subunit alcohol dehydrogenase family)
MSKQRIAVVTGASSGFGRLTAEALGADGWHVFGAMRNVKTKNAEAAAKLRAGGADVVELDVTDDASVDSAAATILARGTPDLVVNNAGTAFFGVEESFSPKLVERQFATNVFGPLRVNRAFLPAMRERRAGLIVFVSSIVGRTTFPLGGVYASSKWALEALAETSSYELAPFGVDVAIVQPGAFHTEIGNNRTEPDDTARAQSYGAAARRFFAVMETLSTSAEGRDPADVARAIVHLANLPAGSRPLRTLVPNDEHIAAINATAGQVQAGLLRSMGLEDLLPKASSAGSAV